MKWIFKKKRVILPVKRIKLPSEYIEETYTILYKKVVVEKAETDLSRFK